MRVKPGIITTILAVPAVFLTLSAAAYPLLRPESPPGYSAAVTTSRKAPQAVQGLTIATEARYETAVRAYHPAKLRKKKITVVVAAVQPPAAPPAVQAPASPASAGYYSYSGLETIWEANGGSSATAAVAACIAEHESGGRADAVSPTADYGLWQEHDDPSALNPGTSAATAVSMSHDGTDWAPWTTAGDCGV